MAIKSSKSTLCCKLNCDSRADHKLLTSMVSQCHLKSHNLVILNVRRLSAFLITAIVSNYVR